MMRTRGLILVLSFVLMSGIPMQAGDDIWAALVLATNEDTKTVPKSLKEFAPTIEEVFGYSTLYLLGEKKRAVYEGREEWLVPTENFFFKVECLKQEEKHYRMRVELYREKQLLLTTEAKLAKDAPLFIRGPQWGKGQLIFLLEVR